VIEHGGEGHAVVRRLVNAAGRRGHVEGGGIALEHRDVVHTSRRRTGTDLPERQPIQRAVADRLLGHGRRDGRRRLGSKPRGEGDEHEQRKRQSVLQHECDVLAVKAGAGRTRGPARAPGAVVATSSPTARRNTAQARSQG
jgi:hypothetical protein